MKIIKILYDISLLTDSVNPLIINNEFLDLKISAVIIVRNEEELISRCLNNIIGKFDEVVVVDTGSTDNTLSVLNDYSDYINIFHFEWCDSFSSARNFAITKTTSKFIFVIDSDEVLKSSRDEIKQSYFIYYFLKK